MVSGCDGAGSLAPASTPLAALAAMSAPAAASRFTIGTVGVTVSTVKLALPPVPALPLISCQLPAATLTDAALVSVLAAPVNVAVYCVGLTSFRLLNVPPTTLVSARLNEPFGASLNVKEIVEGP